MWLQRIMFNLKFRLLHQSRDTDYAPAQTPVSLPPVEATRAQIIQNRLLDLDERLEHLQSR